MMILEQWNDLRPVAESYDYALASRQPPLDGTFY
jgi:hypothetical protein